MDSLVEIDGCYRSKSNPKWPYFPNLVYFSKSNDKHLHARCVRKVIGHVRETVSVQQMT